MVFCLILSAYPCILNAVLLNYGLSGLPIIRSTYTVYLT